MFLGWILFHETLLHNKIVVQHFQNFCENIAKHCFSCVLGFKKLQETGTTEGQPGSGRPCTLHTAENIDAVNDLALWIVNRKSQVADSSMSIPMTLNDLKKRLKKLQRWGYQTVKTALR